ARAAYRAAAENLLALLEAVIGAVDGAGWTLQAKRLFFTLCVRRLLRDRDQRTGHGNGQKHPSAHEDRSCILVTARPTLQTTLVTNCSVKAASWGHAATSVARSASNASLDHSAASPRSMPSHHGQTPGASLELPSITLTGLRSPVAAASMRSARASARFSDGSHSRSWPHMLGPQVTSCGCQFSTSITRPPQPYSTMKPDGELE